MSSLTPAKTLPQRDKKAKITDTKQGQVNIMDLLGREQCPRPVFLYIHSLYLKDLNTNRKRKLTLGIYPH